MAVARLQMGTFVVAHHPRSKLGGYDDLGQANPEHNEVQTRALDDV